MVSRVSPGEFGGEKISRPEPGFELRSVGTSVVGIYIYIYIYIYTYMFFWLDSPQWARASSCMRFLDHTRHTTVGRTPLDE